MKCLQANNQAQRAPTTLQFNLLLLFKSLPHPRLYLCMHSYA